MLEKSRESMLQCVRGAYDVQKTTNYINKIVYVAFLNHMILPHERRPTMAKGGVMVMVPESEIFQKFVELGQRGCKLVNVSPEDDGLMWRRQTRILRTSRTSL